MTYSPETAARLVREGRESVDSVTFDVEERAVDMPFAPHHEDAAAWWYVCSTDGSIHVACRSEEDALFFASSIKRQRAMCDALEAAALEVEMLTEERDVLALSSIPRDVFSPHAARARSKIRDMSRRIVRLRPWPAEAELHCDAHGYYDGRIGCVGCDRDRLAAEVEHLSKNGPAWLRFALQCLHSQVDRTDPNDPVGAALTRAGLERLGADYGPEHADHVAQNTRLSAPVRELELTEEDVAALRDLSRWMHGDLAGNGFEAYCAALAVLDRLTKPGAK